MCFIDSSEAGQTAYNILRYCASIGRERVVFIDPLHTYVFKKIAPIVVFGDSPNESANKVWDIIQIQFQQKESTETPVIKQYLPAIIRVLHEAGMTLAESIYFTQPAYIEQREFIFSKARRLKHEVLMLRSAFENRDIYREYRPTARRILDILHPTLSLYFGSKKGLDFTRIIADKYVLIVNLYPQKDFGKSEARFWGTAIINEIISAMDSLTGNQFEDNWDGRYYLYIDEVGRYANRNLADVLDYKGKTGLFLTLAHQNLGQIEDSKVRDAILSQTSTKVVFRIESEDIDRIAKRLYGGDIQDRQAAHYINRLQKQECIIKLPGLDAKTVFVRDVLTPEVDWKSYLAKIYSTYVPIDDIRKEQGVRVKTYQTKPSDRPYDAPRTSHPSSKKASKAAHRPDSKVAAPPGRDKDVSEREDPFRRLRKDEAAPPADDKK